MSERELRDALSERFGEVISPEGIDFITRAALTASRQSILEEAAKVAEVEKKAWGGRAAYACAEVACENIASAIRSLTQPENAG